jgi:DNA polymerase-3 subunit epsilon/ATP-dependent DNA helicase DinG
MSRVYVALDIETTGLSPERDAIIEIGAVKFRGEEVLDTFTSLVNPDRTLTYRILQLTGITQAQVNAAPSVRAILGPLNRFVGDAPIVGHNVNFDLSFLNRHNLFLTNPRLDTFEIASILMPHADRYNLGKLAEELGLHMPVQHRALDDARAAKDLFLALIVRALTLDPATLSEINRLAARTDWSLKSVFQDIERERARWAFNNTIGARLAAKGSLDDGALSLFFESSDDLEPLEPAERHQPIDVDRLAGMLEVGGELHRHLPGYEHRPQQVAMLRAVSEAFNTGDHLLVEAGTGTGKSLAYLLPAIHFAVANGRRVVVSTNTINLQEQLYKKDLPLLQEILQEQPGRKPEGAKGPDVPFAPSSPFTFLAAVLKGRTNYLCRRRLDVLRQRDGLTTDEVRTLAKVLAWLPTTATGDVAELTMTPPDWNVWARLRADAEVCQPETCAYAGSKCFFYRAHIQAEAAHIVIVNHALLLSDLALENRVLPEHKHLVIDEAHHLEARATEQLGFEVDQVGVSSTLRALSHLAGPNTRPTGFLAELGAGLARARLPAQVRRQVDGALEGLHQDVDRAQTHLAELFRVLDEFLTQHTEGRRVQGGYDFQVRITRGLRVQPDWGHVEIAWEDLAVVLANVHRGLERLLRSLSDTDDFEVPDAGEWLGELSGYRQRIGELREQLTAILSEPREDAIYWVNLSARDENISLHAAPLHVGPLLQKGLFDNKETVVLTSATLRTGDEFRFIRQRLGLEYARELAVGSPFDFESSTLLYLPTDVPEPGQPNYQKTVEKALVDLCRATRGRTLTLFTSHSQLKTTYEAISRPLGDEGILVLAQNLDGSRSQLLETFRAGQETVLLGTRSFWEGIDVVGEALSCLVIARLPFDVPSDPIFAARAETFEDPFNQYSVPQTILRFRQGFGRLIRSKTDRGVVVVLDRRLLTKSYGRQFIQSLPTCTLRRGPLAALPDMAARWIAGRVTTEGGEEEE